MRIKYLGTAAAEGIPALFCSCEICKKVRKTRGKDIRTRSSALIDDRLKLDFGPDSFLQMMRFDLDYSTLRSVLITHTHEDHLCVGDLLCRKEGFAQVPDDIPILHVYGMSMLDARSPRSKRNDLRLYKCIRSKPLRSRAMR